MSARLRFSRKDGEAFEACLERVLARGGSGVVHEARRLDGGRETFVVKQGAASDRRLVALERRVCEALDHPSIIRYLGSAQDDRQEELLAFERLSPNPLLLLSGVSARPAWKDPGTTYFPLPPGRALELAFDLLLGIEHLHERDLVHADVKLANLLVHTPSAASGGTSSLAEVARGSFRGVLIDLGSVRSVALLEQLRRGEADPALLPALTPLYAPPEALFERSELGGRKIFSPAMDVYAFGLVFSSLLTGRVPYEHVVPGERLRERDAVLELKLREARGDVSPLAPGALEAIPLHDVAFARPIEHAWPSFVMACERVIRECTRLDPRQRWTAAQARAALERDLGIRAGSDEARAWRQTIFQMRPHANRLLGDVPLGGIRVSGEGETLVSEEAPPRRGETIDLSRSIVVGRDVETIVERRAEGATSPEPVPSRVLLADVLRELKARRPLPVRGPVLATRLGSSARDLARCALVPLGEANGDADGARALTVGRGEGNDVILADPSVSKKHLAIESRDGDWWVRDLGSSNGTFVNGRPLPREGSVRLHADSARIHLGPTAQLAYMAGKALDEFLAHALDLWTQAFGALPSAHARSSSSPRPTRRPDAVSATSLEWPPREWPARATAGSVPATGDGTERYEEGETPWLPANPTRRVLPAPPAAPIDLAADAPVDGIHDVEERLRAHASPGTRFVIVLEGARIEVLGCVAEVLACIGEEGGAVLSIDARHRDGARVELFRRSPTAA